MNPQAVCIMPETAYRHLATRVWTLTAVRQYGEARNPSSYELSLEWRGFFRRAAFKVAVWRGRLNIAYCSTYLEDYPKASIQFDGSGGNIRIEAVVLPTLARADLLVRFAIRDLDLVKLLQQAMDFLDISKPIISQ